MRRQSSVLAATATAHAATSGDAVSRIAGALIGAASLAFSPSLANAKEQTTV
jgi:hypothetical protein